MIKGMNYIQTKMETHLEEWVLDFSLRARKLNLKSKEHHSFMLRKMLTGDSKFFLKYRCCGFTAVAAYYLALNLMGSANFKGCVIAPTQRALKDIKDRIREMASVFWGQELITKQGTSSVSFIENNIEFRTRDWSDPLSACNRGLYYDTNEKFDVVIFDEILPEKGSDFQYFVTTIPHTNQLICGTSIVSTSEFKEVLHHFKCIGYDEVEFIKMHYMMDPDNWDGEEIPNLINALGNEKFSEQFE